MSLALDHKADEGGSLMVYIIVAASLLFIALFFIIEGMPRYAQRSERLFAFSVLAPVAATVIPLTLNTVSMDAFVRAAIPYIYLFLGLHVALRLRSERDRYVAYRLIFFGGAVSVAFTLWHAYVGLGVSNQSARYEIISSFSGAIFLASLCEMFVLRLFSFRKFVALFVVTLIALLSVTRSYMLTLIASAVACYYLSKASKVVRANIKTKGVLVIAVATSAIVSVVVFPELVDRWMIRIFEARADTGIDVTSLTRIAEIAGQWEILTSDLSSLVFGRGLGASYYWSSEYEYVLAPFLSQRHYDSTYQYVGHNFWVYSLFANGLIIGLIQPLALVWLAVNSFTVVVKRQVFIAGPWNGYLFILGTSYLVFTIVGTIGGNPLGSRSASFLIGIFLGTLLVSTHKINSIVRYNR